MKKITLFLTFYLILSTIIFSQNKETKSLLSSIEGQWLVDDNSNITYQKVVELAGFSKDKIYQNAKSFFIYNYSSGKSVIQSDDKEDGILIAKGLYLDVIFTTNGVASCNYDTWHIIKIEVKEGKARITLSLTGYNLDITSLGEKFYYDNVKISNYYPINPEGNFKNFYGKALYYSHIRALNTLEAIETALKEGSVSNSENDNW